jgi:hypothetical protein
MTTDNVVKAVVQGLDELIMQNLKGVAQQQYFPVPDPDEMDDRIKQGKERAKELRRLRQEFEDLCAGVL